MKPKIIKKKSVFPILGFLLCSSAMATPVIPAARQAELIHLLKQDCGSCHGMTLKGGLGPALTAEALAGKPVAFLRQVVLDGRPGTAMPPWRGLLSEAEVAWLVDRMIEGKVDGR